MHDLKLAWSHATDHGRICGLRLMAWSIVGGAALLLAIALFLVLEPVS